MPWDQSVGISGLKTNMAVEDIQQIDVSELGSDIISEDKLNVDSETVDLGTGMTMKENVGTDTSNLASGEKMINDSERNDAATDSSMDISGVGKSQQANVSELSHVLPTSKNLNDNPKLRKDDVREEAKGCDASEMLSPMKGEYGYDNIETNVPRNVAEVPDACKVLPPKKVEDADASMGIHIVRVETEKPDASRTCGPAKGEDGDAFKTISLVQDQDDDTEIRTNKLMNEGGAGLNSPHVLSKCSFAAHGIVLAAQNREGQSESKRLVMSRQRKQSKYLSPPYVYLSKGVKGSNQENSAVLGDEEGSDLHGSFPSASKSGSKGKQRKLLTKSVVSSGNLQEISASSGELLSELHLTALDCLYPCEKEHFDPMEKFFTIFRSSVFRDKSNVEADKKEIGFRTEKELEGGICEENASDMETKSEAQKRKRKEKPSKEAISTPDLNGNSLNSKVLEDGSQSEGPSVLTGMLGPKKRGRKKGTVRAITNPDGNDSSMDSKGLAADLQSESPSVLTRMSGLKKRGKKKNTVLANTSPDGNSNSNNNNELAAGSQSEDPPILTSMPSPKKRGRMKRTVLANTDPYGNPERKKRQSRRKDGTYIDDLPNVNAHTPDTSMLNSKPISLEICLRNVEPTPPALMCPLNTSPSPAALPGEAPSLDEVKKTLGLITTTLEKSWNNLLPEMKVTLEIEVQELLKKVTSMSSSSSS